MSWFQSGTPQYQGTSGKQAATAIVPGCFGWFGRFLKTPTPSYKTVYIEPVAGKSGKTKSKS